MGALDGLGNSIVSLCRFAAPAVSGIVVSYFGNSGPALGSTGVALLALVFLKFMERAESRSKGKHATPGTLDSSKKTN